MSAPVPLPKAAARYSDKPQILTASVESHMATPRRLRVKKNHVETRGIRPTSRASSFTENVRASSWQRSTKRCIHFVRNSARAFCLRRLATKLGLRRSMVLHDEQHGARTAVHEGSAQHPQTNRVQWDKTTANGCSTTISSLAALLPATPNRTVTENSDYSSWRPDAQRGQAHADADIWHWSDACTRQHLGWVSPSVARGKHLRRRWDRREALVYSCAKWDAHAKNYESSAASSSLRRHVLRHLSPAKREDSLAHRRRRLPLSAAMAGCVAPARAFRGRHLGTAHCEPNVVNKKAQNRNTSSWNVQSSISIGVSI